MNKILIFTVFVLFTSSCINNQTADELYSNAEVSRNEKDIKSALSNLDSVSYTHLTLPTKA